MSPLCSAILFDTCAFASTSRDVTHKHTYICIRAQLYIYTHTHTHTSRDVDI